MANDFRKLKEEADIEEVVNYLGIETYPRGDAIFIHCPSPQHKDKHATNCYFKHGWNNVYCWSCCKQFQAIDLIMYESGCDYGTAAEILWNIEGRPDWYKDKSWKDKSIHKKFSLTGKECRLIGIKLPNYVLMPKKYTEIPDFLNHEKIKGFEYDKREIDGYLLSERCKTSWEDFMTEKEFKELVRRKCLEKLNKYKRLNDVMEVKHLFKVEIRAIENIWRKTYGKPPITR